MFTRGYITLLAHDSSAIISRPAVLRFCGSGRDRSRAESSPCSLQFAKLAGYRPTRPMSRRSFASDQQHDLPSSSDSSAYNSSVMLLHTAQVFTSGCKALGVHRAYPTRLRWVSQNLSQKVDWIPSGKLT